jgi:hypothetical protein
VRQDQSRCVGDLVAGSTRQAPEREDSAVKAGPYDPADAPLKHLGRVWSSQDLVDSDVEHAVPERRSPCPQAKTVTYPAVAPRGRCRPRWLHCEPHRKQPLNAALVAPPRASVGCLSAVST